MRPCDAALCARLDRALTTYRGHSLPGIRKRANRTTLLEQIIESVRRVEYVRTLRQLELSTRRGEPNSELFDPLKAAILQQREGNVEEAFWLVFLFVHFGRSTRGGWRYVRDIYGRLGGPGSWDWPSISADPTGFRGWLRRHQAEILQGQPRCSFGNHRKYQSLDADKDIGTGAAVETYVGWVGPTHSHRNMIRVALQRADGDNVVAFDQLYNSMTAVASFGRTARFDYLTMLGKLDLAAIVPGSAYIASATGPKRGARLLFGDGITPADLDGLVALLGSHLQLGMQVMEDALCNWVKNPSAFKAFRG